MLIEESKLESGTPHGGRAGLPHRKLSKAELAARLRAAPTQYDLDEICEMGGVQLDEIGEENVYFIVLATGESGFYPQARRLL